MDIQKAGTYKAIVGYEGIYNYYGTTLSTTIVVYKKSSTLTAPKVTATYAVNKYLVINLKDASGNILANKKVTVKVGTISKTLTTNAKGQVSVLVSSLVPKTYTATISFAGDSYYDKSSTTASVVVKKATPRLTAYAKTFRKSVKTKKYTITLIQLRGRLLIHLTKITIFLLTIHYWEYIVNIL